MLIIIERGGAITEVVLFIDDESGELLSCNLEPTAALFSEFDKLLLFVTDFENRLIFLLLFLFLTIKNLMVEHLLEAISVFRVLLQTLQNERCHLG